MVFKFKFLLYITSNYTEIPFDFKSIKYQEKSLKKGAFILFLNLRPQIVGKGV